jgi:hypothetical protein
LLKVFDDSEIGMDLNNIKATKVAVYTDQTVKG